MHLSPHAASALIWLLFIVYWSAAAKNSAPTVSAESVKSRQLHVLLMYGAIILALVRVPGLSQRWLPESDPLVIAGFVIQLGAFALAVWARRHLGSNWSANIAAKVDHSLIRSGPYQIVRHPIYSVMLGMFLGTALISGEVHALLGLIVMSMAYYRKIRLEEQALRATFGAEYEDYQQSSSALIPGVY
jgi:protein-S-isoprenylcysteine O-methyltransferase Ste14